MGGDEGEGLGLAVAIAGHAAVEADDGDGDDVVGDEFFDEGPGLVEVAEDFEDAGAGLHDAGIAGGDLHGAEAGLVGLGDLAVLEGPGGEGGVGGGEIGVEFYGALEGIGGTREV